VTKTLRLLEREVEQARAKLADDLAVLRSPQTIGDGLRFEARSFFQRILDDLKARAAANPSAALAIGAGIGWRLVKHPPIASALIGAGLLSLWRTPPVHVNEEDSLTTAQERFGKQLSEALGTAKVYATDTIGSAKEKASEYAQSVQEKAQVLASSAAAGATAGFEQAGEIARRFPNRAKNAAQQATSQLSSAVRDETIRDQLLLGVASVAVAAVLGITYQRRASHEGRQ
jgi:hypothetical protein